MNTKLFTTEQVLECTPAGHLALQQRTQNLSPKLRAVLYLIDGKSTLAALLDGVGSMAARIASQIDMLGEMGLLQIKERRKVPRPAEIAGVALVAAKAHRADNAEPQNTPASNFFNPSQFGDFSEAAGMPRRDVMRPLMGAKLELLGLLEKMEFDKIEVMAATLLEPKNLKELAFRTKELAIELEPIIGDVPSQAFWTAAKVVLMRWRTQGNLA